MLSAPDCVASYGHYCGYCGLAADFVFWWLSALRRHTAPWLLGWSEICLSDRQRENRMVTNNKAKVIDLRDTLTNQHIDASEGQHASHHQASLLPQLPQNAAVPLRAVPQLLQALPSTLTGAPPAGGMLSCRAFTASSEATCSNICRRSPWFSAFVSPRGSREKEKSCVSEVDRAGKTGVRTVRERKKSNLRHTALFLRGRLVDEVWVRLPLLRVGVLVSRLVSTRVETLRGHLSETGNGRRTSQQQPRKKRF
jgi:hypothetical protein